MRKKLREHMEREVARVKKLSNRQLLDEAIHRLEGRWECEFSEYEQIDFDVLNSELEFRLKCWLGEE